MVIHIILRDKNINIVKSKMNNYKKKEKNMNE